MSSWSRAHSVRCHTSSKDEGIVKARQLDPQLCRLPFVVKGVSVSLAETLCPWWAIAALGSAQVVARMETSCVATVAQRCSDSRHGTKARKNLDLNFREPDSNSMVCRGEVGSPAVTSGQSAGVETVERLSDSGAKVHLIGDFRWPEEYSSFLEGESDACDDFEFFGLALTSASLAAVDELYYSGDSPRETSQARERHSHVFPTRVEHTADDRSTLSKSGGEDSTVSARSRGSQSSGSRLWPAEKCNSAPCTDMATGRDQVDVSGASDAQVSADASSADDMAQSSPRKAALATQAGSSEYYVANRDSKARNVPEQPTTPNHVEAVAPATTADNGAKGHPSDKVASAPGQSRRTGRKWADEEDRLLLSLVKEYPHDAQNYWQTIANQMRVKNAKQCRERYNNHLRPGLIKGADFTPEEDAMLISLHQKWGNRWSHIAKFMPGRPENDLKNRFYAASRCLGTRRPTRGRSRRCTLKKYIQRTGCIKMKSNGGQRVDGSDSGQDAGEDGNCTAGSDMEAQGAPGGLLGGGDVIDGDSDDAAPRVQARPQPLVWRSISGPDGSAAAAAGSKPKYTLGVDVGAGEAPTPLHTPVQRRSSCLSTVQYEGNVCQGAARTHGGHSSSDELAAHVAEEKVSRGQPGSSDRAGVVSKFGGPGPADSWPALGPVTASDARQTSDSSPHSELFSSAGTSSFVSGHSLPGCAREPLPKRARVTYLADSWPEGQGSPGGMHSPDAVGYQPAQRAPAHQVQPARRYQQAPMPRAPIVEGADGLMWAHAADPPAQQRQLSTGSIPPPSSPTAASYAACAGASSIPHDLGQVLNRSRSAALAAHDELSSIGRALGGFAAAFMGMQGGAPGRTPEVDFSQIPGEGWGLVKGMVSSIKRGEVDLQCSLPEAMRRQAEMSGVPVNARRLHQMSMRAQGRAAYAHAPQQQADAWQFAESFMGASPLGLYQVQNNVSRNSFGSYIHNGADEKHSQAGQSRTAAQTMAVHKVRLAHTQQQQARDAQGAPGWLLQGADMGMGEETVPAGSLSDEDAWFHPTFDYDSCSHVTASVATPPTGLDVTLAEDKVSRGPPHSNVSASVAADGGARYHSVQGRVGLHDLLASNSKRLVSFNDRREGAKWVHGAPLAVVGHAGEDYGDVMAVTEGSTEMCGASTSWGMNGAAGGGYASAGHMGAAGVAGDHAWSPAGDLGGTAFEDMQPPSVAWTPLVVSHMPKKVAPPCLAQPQVQLAPPMAEDGCLAESGSVPRGVPRRDNIVVAHGEMAVEQLEMMVMDDAAKYQPSVSDKERGVVYMVSRIVPVALPDGKEVVEFNCFNTSANVQALFNGVCEAIREVCGRPNIFNVTIMSRIGQVPAGGLFFFFGVHASTVEVAQRAAEVAGELVFEGSKGLAIRMGIK